jgi:hypothetical protein
MVLQPLLELGTKGQLYGIIVLPTNFQPLQFFAGAAFATEW